MKNGVQNEAVQTKAGQVSPICSESGTMFLDISLKGGFIGLFSG